MSHHKHIFDRAFNRHSHLNRAAAAVDKEDAHAAQESAAAASSRAAAVAAAAAAASSKEAAKASASETIPATFTTPLTLPGDQILPVPHGSTPEAIAEPTTSPAVSALRATPSSVVSVPHASSTLVPVTTEAQSFASTTSSVRPAQDASSAPTSVSSSKKLSSGATGAIVAIVVLLLAIVGTVVVRKFYMRRRAMKRNTWGAGLVPALENKRSTVYEQSSIVSEPKSVMSQTTASFTTLPTPTSVTLPSPPSLSYTPSAPTSIAPVVLPNVVVTNSGVSSPSMPAAAAEFAVVVRTFVPTLPDELHISNGEHIRIISSFDDGWALCSNVRGDQGVVPLECLHRETFSTEMQLQPESEFGYDSNKAARRLSSLVPSTGATY